MNKKIFALCLCGLMTIGMTACQTKNEETVATTTTAATTAAETTADETTAAAQTEETTTDVLAVDDETIKKMIEVNTLDNLLKTYDNVAANIISYGVDGEEKSSAYYYGDADLYVTEFSDGSVTVTGNNEQYGFDGPAAVPFAALFADTVYEEFTGYYRDYFFYAFDLDEYVKEKSTADGITTIKTYVNSEQAKNYFTAEDLSAMGDFTNYVTVYEINAETSEFISMNSSVEYADGSSKLFTTVTALTNVDKYTPSEELYSSTHGEGRTYTAVFDPDTENERSFSVTVPDGAAIMPYFPMDYTGMYSDRECTTIIESSNDREGDVTMYLAAGK